MQAGRIWDELALAKNTVFCVAFPQAFVLLQTTADSQFMGGILRIKDVALPRQIPLLFMVAMKIWVGLFALWAKLHQIPRPGLRWHKSPPSEVNLLNSEPGVPLQIRHH